MMALKCGPLLPRWLMARGMNAWVDEVCRGWDDFMSLSN